MLFWLFKGGFKVSSGIVKWYRTNYGIDFGSVETADPVVGSQRECRAPGLELI